MKRLLVLVAFAISMCLPRSAAAHDAPTLRVEIHRVGAFLHVRVDADPPVWALAGTLSRGAAAARAIVAEDEEGRLLPLHATTDGDAVLLVADTKADALLRLTLFGTEDAGEAVVSLKGPGGESLLRVELPGVVRAPPSDLAEGGSEIAATPHVDVGSFVAWGVEHVLTGWDHLAFLLSLLVVAGSVGAALRVATAFTLAHSVTLSLAAFDVVRLPSAPVEAAIAASIVVSAAMTLLRPASTGRLAVAFGFGLVHGLGFSSVLGDLLGGDGGSRALCVAAFNLGVELGQAAVIAAVLPLLLLWRRRAALGYLRYGQPLLSCATGIAGVVWLVARSADLV